MVSGRRKISTPWARPTKWRDAGHDPGPVRGELQFNVFDREKGFVHENHVRP